MLAVWSDGAITHSPGPRQAKLGGSGLGLVALASYEQLEPGSIPLEEFRALGRFIVYLQKPDGNFHSKYIPSEGGPSDQWTSLYYPGEAALGLVMLYELDPDPLWLESASKAIGYLAESRQTQTEVPADHWALLATSRLMALQTELPLERLTLINHAIQICGSILQDQVDHSQATECIGGFDPHGRTTPTATRLEGLLAALKCLPENYFAYGRVKASIPPAIQCLLRAQVSAGPQRGAVPRAMRPRVGESKAIASFNQRATEVRIDYVQHALSAWIEYWDRMKLEHPSSDAP